MTAKSSMHVFLISSRKGSPQSNVFIFQISLRNSCLNCVQEVENFQRSFLIRLFALWTSHSAEDPLLQNRVPANLNSSPKLTSFACKLCWWLDWTLPYSVSARGGSITLLASIFLYLNLEDHYHSSIWKLPFTRAWWRVVIRLTAL